MAKVGLEANVEKSQHCQKFVDPFITERGINVGSNKEILNGLKEFHGEEKEDSGCKSIV